MITTDLGKNLIVIPKTMILGGYAPHPLGALHVASVDENTLIIDNAKDQDVVPEDVFSKTRPKVVGVPIYTAGRSEALRVLRLAKEAGAITVAGGPHVSVMTEQLATHYPFIDHLVVGDGERAWKEITSGTPNLPKILRMRVESFDSLPTPDWTRVDLKKYAESSELIHRGNDLRTAPRLSLIFSRGCVGQCGFCSAWHVAGKHRHYGPKWMFQYLLSLWKMGIRHLVFQDDCLTADMPSAHELCKVLKLFNFSCFGTTRADRIDEDLAKEMSTAGFYNLCFGLESGSEFILEKMHKKADLNVAFKAREAVAKAGMAFTALMVQGYPYETDEDRQKTLDFLIKLKPNNVISCDHTMVMPGTALYIECKRAGLINDDFWLGDEPYYVYRGGLPGNVMHNFLAGKLDQILAR